MINFKSLGLFLFTLFIIIALLAGGVYVGYGKALDLLSMKHPEIKITPSGSATYQVDENLARSFVPFESRGFSLRVPKGCEIKGGPKDPGIEILSGDGSWDMLIMEKTVRYEDTIADDGYLKNPEGDYYILLSHIFGATRNPILLFQKINYLSSDARYIKSIKTPGFVGYFIVGKSGDRRTEQYMLFDQQEWFNVYVDMDEMRVPHKTLETVIAGLKIVPQPEEDEDVDRTVPLNFE